MAYKGVTPFKTGGVGVMRQGCEEQVTVGVCPHCPCHDADDVLECCHCGELSEYDPDDPWGPPHFMPLYG